MDRFQECKLLSIYGRHILISYAFFLFFGFLASSMVHKVKEKEVNPLKSDLI